MTSTSSDPLDSLVEELAHSHWNLQGEWTRLGGDVDRNYRLTCNDGQRFVVKITPESDQGLLDLQHRLMDHLAEASLKLVTPTAVPTVDGKEFVPVEAPNGQHLARVLTFLPGTLWSDLDAYPSRLYRDLGTRLGELNRASTTFSHDHASYRMRWDPRRTLDQRPHILAITDPSKRRLAEHAFHLFAACVTPHMADLRTSVIHCDANDNNLLVETGPQGPYLTGLLDFGDAIETFSICELAIAAAYALLDADVNVDPLDLVTEMVQGYHTAHPLEPIELEVLFPLILSRLVVSVTISAQRRTEDPDNDYWFVTEGPAWQLLERLAPRDPADASDRFLVACGFTADVHPSVETLLDARRRRIGPSLSVSYRDPLSIVRGRGQYLYTNRGRPYLDLVNNVCHVGHCHPRVVEAGTAQMARLNTNTRYLYDGLTAYAERLCATLPDALEVCYFVTSGSEANELALRLAKTHTGRQDLLVVEGAYHGHTGGLIEISPYKFRGPGGTGEPPPHVHVVPVADGYRGVHKGQGRLAANAYSDDVAQIIASIDRPIAGFISESLLGCGGQIVPPEGYFAGVYEHVRKAGGVCIADEVQVGFGRVGSHFWAFEQQDVVPDIVVLGKPIGNGHPMAAVITTRAIADSFNNGMEFFSTFGGNPVSCAIGMAVLDVIEDEGLQQSALELGTRMLEGFRDLQQKYPLIGEARGCGLFLGLELVRDLETLQPAVEETAEVVHRMRQRGMLLSVDGPLHNVIKVKPPMVLDAQDIDMVLRSLDDVFAEVTSAV